MRRAVAALLLLAVPARAANWTVDHAHSRLGFVAQWSGQPFVATFGKWDAKIDFDPANLAQAKADVTIDMSSASSGDPDTDQNLSGPEGFYAAKFPQAHFVATRFRSVANNRYEAAGNLTIHGITRPITLPFTLMITANSAHMTGETTLLRTDFGVGTSQEWTGEKPIAHAVKVTVDLTAARR